MDLLKDTIGKLSTNQKYVIIEGMCNTNKFFENDDKLELRFMDEFFAIEQNIGDISAIIGLQNEYEPQEVDQKDIKMLKDIPEPVVEAPKDGDEPPADGEAPKEAPMKLGDYKWTDTCGKYRNLPQLFCGYKPKESVQHQMQQSTQYAPSSMEAIPKALDEFIHAVTSKPNVYLYQQVIFSQAE